MSFSLRRLTVLTVTNTIRGMRTYATRADIKGKGKAKSTEADNGLDGEWETVIGLEIHAQLKTGRKLFSSASTSYGDVPNTNVNLHDAAFPGTLPQLDLNAVRLSLLTALALNCNINPRSTFDRKHYFYHDIPASYQITQHYNPLARSGRIQINKGDNGSSRTFDVGIHQLQIEQDTAKSQTVGDAVLVDLNRAGTGLMEIVTEPDMRSAEEAGAFVKKLQGLLRRVGSADGDMEKGNLRVDVNVSVHRPGSAFGTRCEIKNINSIRFLQAAIESERRRHIQHYLTTDTPLVQETRGLNELTLQTFSLRSKEEATDYRYMPDSNLPAMVVDPSYLSKLKDQLPEMPWQSVERLTTEYGVTKRDVETLLGLDEYKATGVRYFEDVAGGDKKLAKRAMNWIVHETLGQLGKLNKVWSPTTIPSGLMRQLVTSIEEGTITGTTGKSILKHLLTMPSPPESTTTLESILEELGISASSASAGGGRDGGEDLKDTCRKAMENQPKAVMDAKKGNDKVVMRLVGEVMKISGGRADARKAKVVLEELLTE
ncbi:glutamyl-tRNA(Gln) amidotransferase subunit B, mitochondrial [Kwoniella shandongensis]|uniref:Glutamyl-tRNA(Gln) amidotransferase subunit B, mitochondrial n=1 Tax=Kwoniella shandongensis TaxID=1734106 RepID=A0A5M6C764_9TREE|nr:glutamyl-tRNA(Gln) amidotransferase subunit B, mitochondrial [Kwoniella shandongensis]KAA5530966.1 glutamyl-tRNA(Gln) amidotransferase subunit B, mitochondrial [Kwoniella shandongensis]